MSRTYAVRELFLTLQGEGVWTGARAVFVRLTGCNVWSGDPAHRVRDTENGVCAAWCDTEFRGTDGQGGGRYSASQLVAKIVEAWGARDDVGVRRIVVFTGGEPGLQLTDELVRAVRDAGFRVHVETNGSKSLPAEVDWVTLSPKPPMPITLRRVPDEVKVVLAPGIDPAHFVGAAREAHFVQPLDTGDPETRQAAVRAAIEYVLANPRWRLTLQTHKALGLP